MGKRIFWGLIVLTLLAALSPWRVDATQHPTLRWGSTGDYVYLAQQRLSDWGYLRGPVDGVYGRQTYGALLDFQRTNGLTVDGVVGPQTWRALGENVPDRAAAAPAGGGGGGGGGGAAGGLRADERDLLARLVAAEARGEPYEGQVAVAAVTLNRIRDSRFPNSLAGVVYQKWAYESVDDGQIYMPATETAIRAAQDALNGWDPTGGAVYFWNPATATSAWIWSLPVTKRIGRHVFAK